ncbi:MAG: MurR/RpiR family transcriptional regulator [Calditrichaeota bacterium]|nr:MAG: MurR/RpiR family transcriptional regulator [Calditrichota bacterium]
MQNNLKDLKKRIRSKIPYLTDSQKHIANFIVENPQKFALSSVRELEKELHTSKSTIVRLAQSLGYNGFYEMKNAFLQKIRHELEPLNRYRTFLSEPTAESDYLKLIAEESINNIKSTLVLIDKEQLKKAIKLIEGASHIYTIGLGISTYLAEIAAYLLNRVSIKANAMSYGGYTFAEQIIKLSREDVIFAFSFLPYSEETIDAACYANERGIKVISVTDKATSQIVQYSDVVLQAAVDGIAISNSIMSVLVVLYAITGQIGYELKNKTLQTIRSMEHVRKEHSKKKLKKL